MMQFTSGEDVSGLFSNTDSFGFDLIYLRILNNVLVKNETPYFVTYVEEQLQRKSDVYVIAAASLNQIPKGFYLTE